MVRDLNISLITGIIGGNLPIWQWDTRTGWLEDKKTKKKNPTAATVKVQ